jgi:hypothetical protein
MNNVASAKFTLGRHTSAIPTTEGDRLPGSVVAARPAGGVCTGCKRVPCGALVPVTAGQPSSRCGGDRVAKTHTYEPQAIRRRVPISPWMIFSWDYEID